MQQFHFVKSGTIGEFTNYTDKNDVEIFEGDVFDWGVNSRAIVVQVSFQIKVEILQYMVIAKMEM